MLFSLFSALLRSPPALLASLLTVGVIFVNGWTDAPCTIATCVVTRSLSVRGAVLLAAVCNFLGVLIMTALNATVAQTVTELADFGTKGSEPLIALSAALLAIVLWAIAAWAFGIPTSESHALIAGLSGSAIALHGGFDGLRLAPWGKVLWGLLFSILLGLFGGLGMGKALKTLLARSPRKKANRFLSRAQIVGAAAMSFMHGAQDGQKFMGVLLLITCLSRGQDPLSAFRIPLPLMAFCAAVMALGTAMGGKKIIRAMGMSMVKPQAYQGFAADLAAALTMLISSLGGIPISSTHVKITAMMGAGASHRLSSVRLSAVKEIALTWALTFPGCGAVGYLMTKLFLHCF